MGRLTAVGVRSLRRPGKFTDGAGLVLHVKSPTRRYWTFRYERAGHERSMILGSAENITLVEARQRHADARALLLKGLDPLDERGKVKVDLSHTFAQVAEACIAKHEPEWRSPRSAAQWRASLRDYVLPVIGKLPVAEISVDHVLRVLRPIWQTKPQTAGRVRSRIEATLDYAVAMRWRPDTVPNPAVWRGGLKHLLAKPQKQVKHHAALPWRDAPALMTDLRERQTGMGSLALTFLILTACRSGEVRGCRWDEIDMHEQVWTIPGSRMKAGREHRVPLSEPAMGILRMLTEVRTGPLVFFGTGSKDRPLSDVTLKEVLRRLGHADITVHGMRSTFRNWCAEATNYPREVAEMALAHTVGSAVERAYQRSDLLDKRRSLMQSWSDFLTKPPAQVVPLRRA